MPLDGEDIQPSRGNQGELDNKRGAAVVRRH